MREQDDRTFGEAAIRRGFLTDPQLTEYLDLAAKATQIGLDRTLTGILLEKGALTEFQVELIHRSLVGEDEKRVIGGFELVEKIGEGGMGAVYKARQVSMDRVVALKLLPPDLAKDEGFAARFLREARMAAKLDHVNIVRGIDVGKDGNDYYFAMEFVEGESGGDLLEREGSLPEERALRIVIQVARALEHAWESKLVHRDIKPDNILLTKDDVAKLADMGLARQTEPDSTVLTQTGMAMGTPRYMSPEQAQGEKDIDARTDIYSLGATLYHMVTGRAPFTGSTAAVVITKHLTEDPVPAHERNTNVSELTSRIIAKMMQKKREERYSSATELLKDLELAIEAVRRGYTVRGNHLSTIAYSTSKGIFEGAPFSEADIDGKAPELAGAAVARTLVESAGETAATQAKMVRPKKSPVKWLVPAVVAGVLLIVGAAGALVWTGTKRAEERGRHAATREAAKAKLDVARALVAEGKLEEAREKLQASTEKIKAAGLAGELDGLLAEMSRDESEAERARLAAREKRVAVQSLLVEAARDEQAGEWKKALAKYEKALEDAEGGLREKALARLRELKKRIRVEETVSAVIREAEAGRWREAWTRITDARSAGIEDARLAGLSKRTAAHLGPQESLTGPLGMELVLVPGGTFRMGSDAGEADERPVHAVTVSSFYVGRHEVTKAQFEAFRRGRREAAARGGPAVSVSWREAADFCRYLSSIDPGSASCRLPTEAEWEFAARGPSGRTYPWGDEPPTLLRANLTLGGKGLGRLAPVGSFPDGATPDGIHDLIGNVGEWCGDWHGPYGARPGTDPTGPVAGTMRIVRGGAYALNEAWARASVRGRRLPERPSELLGLRVVRELTREERFFEGMTKGE